MIMAELEAYYSRPVAPTRRVALGALTLPTDPPPGFGGILLGGVMARFAPFLDDDLYDDVVMLMGELGRRDRVAQPRMRHRFQVDQVGLQRCRHRLLGDGESLSFRFDEEVGTPAQHVLCAIYAAAKVEPRARPAVMATVRAGLVWGGPVDQRLIAHLAGRVSSASVDALSDPIRWATLALGLLAGGRSAATVDRATVRAAFREQIMAIHPDQGGDAAEAARRIEELSEARRILLGSMAR